MKKEISLAELLSQMETLLDEVSGGDVSLVISDEHGRRFLLSALATEQAQLRSTDLRAIEEVLTRVETLNRLVQAPDPEPLAPPADAHAGIDVLLDDEPAPAPTLTEFEVSLDDDEPPKPAGGDYVQVDLD